MRPSQVRERILADHGRLRERMAALQEVVERVLEGTPGLEERARHDGEGLRRHFLEHLDLEDRYLVPALREIDAWGEERAARVVKEHREQRQRMEVLLRHLQDPTTHARWIAAELASLVQDLLVDMEHEESAVLSENLLRDDPVGIDVEAG